MELVAEVLVQEKKALDESKWFNTCSNTSDLGHGGKEPLIYFASVLSSVGDELN